MNDTPASIQLLFDHLMQQKTGETRLKMGCSMFDTAKQLAEANIRESVPGITLSELRRTFFLRFYGSDFNPEDRGRIIRFLTEKEPKQYQ